MATICGGLGRGLAKTQTTASQRTTKPTPPSASALSLCMRHSHTATCAQNSTLLRQSSPPWLWLWLTSIYHRRRHSVNNKLVVINHPSSANSGLRWQEIPIQMDKSKFQLYHYQHRARTYIHMHNHLLVKDCLWQHFLPGIISFIYYLHCFICCLIINPADIGPTVSHRKNHRNNGHTYTQRHECIMWYSYWC